MTSLAASLLASPVFGLSLNPPSAQPLIDPAVYAVVAADIHAATPALLQAAEGEAEDEAHERRRRPGSVRRRVVEGQGQSAGLELRREQ